MKLDGNTKPMKKLLNALPIAIALFLLYQGLQKISPSKASETCAVVKGSIHDGDTFRANCSGQEIKIRSACIDAPEIKQENGIASRDHLRSLLNRSSNQVNIKPVDVDRYGRTVAEIYSNDQLVQLQQVRDGFVWANDRYKSDCPHWNEVEKAFTQARSQRKGIFTRGNVIPPWEWRKRK